MKSLLSILTSCLVAVLFSVHPAFAADAEIRTTTPIKYLVVIYQENVSFDHYFATYPLALNPPNEPSFKAEANTPMPNSLTQRLLTMNPNSAQPRRLSRKDAATCSQGHDYTAELKAYNNGVLDKFVGYLGARAPGCDPAEVMGYYDGNTVTALWNYARRFAMSDSFYATTFGPSTPGALNLVSGVVRGAMPKEVAAPWGVEVSNGVVIGDPEPAFDTCAGLEKVEMTGRNIGDLLNAKGVSWGWFQGGFRPSGDTPICGARHMGANGRPIPDYVPHHAPFQYYKSTANPLHLLPSSASMIGQTDQANHQYDLSGLWEAVSAGNLPAVSFIKASAYQNGHAGYSSPLAEQTFITDTVNRLQKLPQWKEMAVIIAYDDSGGWYDHVAPPEPAKAANAPVRCAALPNGRYPPGCGYGPRLPLIVISPCAKTNYIDHAITDQSSILRFVEDNWTLGRIGGSADEQAGPLSGLFDFNNCRPGRRLILDPDSGQAIK